MECSHNLFEFWVLHLLFFSTFEAMRPLRYARSYTNCRTCVLCTQHNTNVMAACGGCIVVAVKNCATFFILFGCKCKSGYELCSNAAGTSKSERLVCFIQIDSTHTNTPEVSVQIIQSRLKICFSRYFKFKCGGLGVCGVGAAVAGVVKYPTC